MKTRNSIAALTFAAVVAGCGPSLPTYDDTPTSGAVSISVDETFGPIAQAELDVFHSQYRYANVSSHFVSEAAAWQDLVNDSSRLIITAREPNADEKKYFEGRKLILRVTKIAVDAVALIVNNSNTDSVITRAQLSQLLAGTTKTWKQLDANMPDADVKVVFDNAGSSTARFLKDSMNGGKEFQPNCYAVKSNEEVIKYVETNKDAMGVIGVSWISDSDDQASKDFLKRIKVMRVGDGSAETPHRPYQAYIAQNKYPLLRNVYAVSREAHAGLATGFAAFLAGDSGQRIILKAGIMPATQPVRIVGFHNNK